MKIAQELLRGDKRALARAITLVENHHPKSQELLQEIFPRSGGSFVVGITGSPGSGKSTLVDGLAALITRSDRDLGIVAVDPSSPFTGGAVLGDRIRMMQHSSDPRVFIRSMATRGHLGGLAKATGDVIVLLEAAGKDFVLVETVGVGQDEVEVVRLAELILVILTPDVGDDVQVFKAGIMEIADIFVLNKADSPGSDAMERRLHALLELGGEDAVRPLVLKTVAPTGEGIEALWEAIQDRRRSQSPGEIEQRQRRRIGWMLRTILHGKMTERLTAALPEAEFEALVDRICQREIDPYTLADQVLGEIGEA
ncbi:MAG: methylmalonyl Co-A mutase-associated GTPase MeaB [Candidatus Aminicenantaceae bacterium]